jgi:hypothetical protein
MTWNDFIYGLGDLFLESFKLLELLNNEFNWLLILVGAGFGAFWIASLVKFSKKAKEDGTLE